MRSNTILCTLGVLILFSYVNADDAMRAIIMECVNEYGISKEEFKTFLHDGGTEEMEKNGGCVFECIMHKKGAMEGTNLILDKVYEHIDRSPIPDKEALKNLAAECAAKVEGLTEPCEVGRIFGNCFMKQMVAMMPHPPNN